MNRRTFFQTGISAAIGASILGDAQAILGQTPGAARGAAPAPSQAQPAVAPRKLTLDAYSRHLQWLRTADEVADAVFELGCDGLMPSVQPYPGHVAPEQVAKDLPSFVKTLRSHGLRVTQIRGPEITDATNPQIEAILRVGSDLGITHYWFGSYHYDLTKPLTPQIDTVKLSVDKLVKLNQRYHTTVMFHTYAMPTSVGATIWDLLSVMKNFDPKHVGFHWDTGHMSLHGGEMWQVLMQAAGPYIAGVAWKDRGWQQNLGLKGEGGEYPGRDVVRAAQQASRGGRGRGGAGGAAGRGGAAPAPGAQPNAAAGAPGQGGAGGEDQAGPAAGRGGRGRGGDLPVPLPLAGLMARGNGWSCPSVPFGTGTLEVPKIATTLRDINFNGPTLLEAEYENGGAGRGLDKVTLPRQWVLGAMKHDVLMLRSGFMLAPESGLTI
jgi:sugar phosphate isomerase/epimerase